MGWTRYEPLCARHVDVNCIGKTEDPWELPLMTNTTTQTSNIKLKPYRTSLAVPYILSNNSYINKLTVVMCESKNLLTRGRSPKKHQINKPRLESDQLSLATEHVNDRTKASGSLSPKYVNKTIKLPPKKYSLYLDPIQDPSLSSQCRHKTNIKTKVSKILSVRQSSRLSYCPASDRLGRSWDCNSTTRHDLVSKGHK